MVGLLQRVRKWLHDQDDHRYLHDLGAPELMDCGVSRGDFLTALSAPKDTRARMDAMARAHGFQAEVIDEEHWRALGMARACAQCGDRPMCKRWLNGQEEDTGADEFCPNAEQFAELALSHGVKVATGAKPERKPVKKISDYI